MAHPQFSEADIVTSPVNPHANVVASWQKIYVIAIAARLRYWIARGKQPSVLHLGD